MAKQQSTERISLGIAIGHATLRPGERRTHREIAAYCNCSWAAIWLIEQKAIHKLKKRLAYHRDPLIRELVQSLITQ